MHPCGTGEQIHLLFPHSQVYNNFYQNVKQDDGKRQILRLG